MNLGAVLFRLLLTLALVGGIAWAFAHRKKLVPADLQQQI